MKKMIKSIQTSGAFSNRKLRSIKAGQYSDMGYENLDEAYEAWDACIDDIAPFHDELRNYRTDLEAGNMDVTELDCFSGPDDAEAFIWAMWEVDRMIKQAYSKYVDALENYTNLL